MVHEVHEQVYCVCQTESIWDEQTIRLIFKPTYTIFVISNRGCLFIFWHNLISTNFFSIRVLGTIQL